MSGPTHWEVPEPLGVCEILTNDGTSIAVRRHGNPNGPRLVLSHGNGLSIDAYFPFWSRFTERFDLFVYDIRSHGWNPIGDRRVHNVPTFVDDQECVVRDIGRHFGEKPTIGLFHSLSALTALLQAVKEDRNGFSALVLFDPPVCPPGKFPHEMETVGRRLGMIARRRQERFETPEAFGEHLSRTGMFDRASPGVVDLFTRTTLRLAADGAGWELRCPREHEAQICDYFFCWAMSVDLKDVTCPVKAIGADPTVPYSFMPSMDMRELLLADYDFIPGTTHLAQLEEPETCATLALDFLEERGLA